MLISNKIMTLGYAMDLAERGDVFMTNNGPIAVGPNTLRFGQGSFDTEMKQFTILLCAGLQQNDDSYTQNLGFMGD